MHYTATAKIVVEMHIKTMRIVMGEKYSFGVIVSTFFYFSYIKYKFIYGAFQPEQTYRAEPQLFCFPRNFFILFY